jgi:hypothetical protein
MRCEPKPARNTHDNDNKKLTQLGQSTSLYHAQNQKMFGRLHQSKTNLPCQKLMRVMKLMRRTRTTRITRLSLSETRAWISNELRLQTKTTLRESELARIADEWDVEEQSGLRLMQASFAELKRIFGIPAAVGIERARWRVPKIQPLPKIPYLSGSLLAWEVLYFLNFRLRFPGGFWKWAWTASHDTGRGARMNN